MVSAEPVDKQFQLGVAVYGHRTAGGWYNGCWKVYSSENIVYIEGHLIESIELVWSEVKKYVLHHNTTFKLKDVEVLVNQAFENVNEHRGYVKKLCFAVH